MEQLYKSVTENEQLSFSGLFARMQYANEAHKVSAQLQVQSNRLRILCNRIAHEEHTTITDSDFVSAVGISNALIEYFCPQYSNASLADYLAKKPVATIKTLPEASKQSFSCMLKSWKVDANCLCLEVVREDGSSCQISLNNDAKQAGHDGRQWTMLAKSLWQYADLRCHELTAISGKADSYMNNPRTIIVLEPDFLIDASALAACFATSSGDPLVFFLNSLFRDASSEAALQGSMVNSIFDELILNPSADYLELFKHGLANMPIAFVSLGRQAAMNIYNCIRDEHLPQLKSFIANLCEAEILLEPSYICPDYGLQGRLDLLAKQGDSYSIVELKSGKAHPTEVWTSHQMQVIAYNMLIRNAYGARRVSNASILYSASKENSLRHVVNISILEQDLLMCRNRIIGLMHTLASEPEKLFAWLKTFNKFPSNPIIRSKYERYQCLATNLTDYEAEWFTAQVQRVVREIWFVKTGDNGSRSDSSYGHNALWQLSSTEKKATYKIIPDLVPTDQHKNLICFNIPVSDEIADFRQGDIVVLYKQNTSITRQEILRGIIHKLQQDCLEISVRGGLKNNRSFTEGGLWAIEHDTLETSLYSPLASLVAFLSASPQTRKVIFGLQNPLFEVAETQSDSLTDIISRMHSAKELFIVQGPPGTGKTSGLLGTYVSDVFQQSAKNLLILSFTNRAVDEICQCFIRKGIPFLRSGSSTTIEQQLLSEQIKDKRFEEIAEIVLNNRIWVATMQSANAWYLDILKITHFDEIIIDEASQIVESSILGLISQSPKTILIGDQNQLPPIVVQSPMPFEFKNRLLQVLHYGSFNQSLMERLFAVYIAKPEAAVLAMLRSHFRMHESIASLIGHYYNDKLISATPQQTGELQLNHQLPGFLNQRLVWINCPPSTTLHFDALQVSLVCAIAAKLVDSGVVSDINKSLGVVAPFRAMIHALRKELGDDYSMLTIDTVERFQGSERDIIIIALPLKHSNNLSQLQSLSDDGCIDRKLNVALSRAKERIIVLGNLELCQTGVHYAKLIYDIGQKGIIIDSALALQQLQVNYT